MIGRFSQSVRSFVSTAVRRSGDHHDVGGIPGANLPFGIRNRYRLAVIFMVYFGSGLAAPFFILRHQLLKK